MPMESSQLGGEVRGVSRDLILGLALVLLSVVVVLEGLSDLDYSLEVLYAVPMVVAATVLNRWQTVLLALLCASFRSYLTPGPHPIEFWLRFAMAVLAYVGAGMLVSEMSRKRRTLQDAYARLKIAEDLRIGAESQLKTLVESSPAAILTLNQRCEVLAANDAASQLLGFGSAQAMVGRDIAAYLPVFAGALRVNTPGGPIRAASNCWAMRKNGTRFPAGAWFSTYEENGQRRLAAIIVDTSEEVRDREYEGLRSLTESARLLAGAVAHEIRNMCAAIRVVTSNLSHKPNMAGDRDFEALGTLVEGLMRIAAFDLSNAQSRSASRVDVTRVLQALRVVIEPDWSDMDGEIRWQTDEILPYVYADEHALLQVFLNLSANSTRAVKSGGTARLEISSRIEEGHVVIQFADHGPGVDDESKLFQPFRENTDGTGLGLYIARAMMRGFGGELSYIATETGCRFDVILRSYADKEHAGE
jgi:two-component system, LuxR family, sensor kinase FixL